MEAILVLGMCSMLPGDFSLEPVQENNATKLKVTPRSNLLKMASQRRPALDALKKMLSYHERMASVVYGSQLDLHLCLREVHHFH